MATTGIWKIEQNLQKVINYIINPEKTFNTEYGESNYKELHFFEENDGVDYKNEKQFYVSGINCIIENAFEEMMITKKEYGKTKGILGFHAFQSFATRRSYTRKSS